MFLTNGTKKTELTYTLPLFCPRCTRIPKLYWLSEDSHNKIFLKCPCSYNCYLTYEKYIYYLERINTYTFCETKQCNSQSSYYCMICDKWYCSSCATFHMRPKINHRMITKDYFNPNCMICKRELAYYCKDCKKNVCTCKYKDHSNHDIKTLKAIKPNVNINKVKENIDKGENLLSNYFPSLIGHRIDSLEKQIKAIQKKYDEFALKSSEHINFIKTLYASYCHNPNSLNLCYNLQNCAEFTFSEFSGQIPNWKEQIKELLTYLNDSKMFKAYKNELQTLDISFKKRITFSESEGIISLIRINDEKIAASTNDAMIKIYDINTMKIDAILKGHSNAVAYLTLLDNKKLLSASDDLTMKIWNLYQKKYPCEYTISAHDSQIEKTIQLSKDRIASCSSDKTIKIWKDSPPYNLLKTLKGHCGVVTSIIQLKNREYLVSGSGKNEKTLKLWDLEKYECVKTLQKIHCCFANALVEYEKKNVIFVGGHASITIVNSISFQVETIIEHTLSFSSSFAMLGDKYLVFGTDEGYLGYLKMNPVGIVVCTKDNANNIYSLLPINEHTVMMSSFQGMAIIQLNP